MTSQISIVNRSNSSVKPDSFWRKNARGKLQKVIKEHYLRPLSSFPLPPPLPHYVLLDTNILLHQLDLLLHPLFPLPILLPQTVLDEVRHRSLPLFNRVKAWSEEEGKAWTVWNEAAEETWVQRGEGESANDRNDRAIRMVASYLGGLYSGETKTAEPPTKRQKTSTPLSSTKITLLTDDAANRAKALSEGLSAISLPQFLDTLPEELKNVLGEVLAVTGSGLGRDEEGGKKKKFYEEYLPLSVLQVGIKAGTLFQGHFTPNPFNYKEASISTPSLPKPILLLGLESMNRSISGDIVVVQLLPPSQWHRSSSSTDLVLDADTEGRLDDPEVDEMDDEALPGVGVGVAVEGKEEKHEEPQPTARVVGILKRNWRPYVCHLDSSSLPPSSLLSSTAVSIFVSPVSRLIPRIRLRTRQAAFLSGQKFLVTVDRWEVGSKYPEGHFVRALGEVGSKEGEVESLLEEWEVRYAGFGQGILSCLPEEGEGWVVPEKGDDGKGVWKGREDLREEIVCSIDPPGCQDIDDALHAKRLSNGNIEAGVHIADVSHFVHPDNPMDAEAASRGTTVYLVDKRIDMLPALLGTNLCSLRPRVERLAFSVIWEINEEAEIVNVRFTKSVIASKEAFTYEAAQKRKDDLSLNDPLTEGIRLLNSVAIKLRANRMKAGALNLASPEVKIHMESSESSDPVDVEQKELFETNSLVEEFMLLANISVAKKIYEKFPMTAVLRRHAPPPKTNFEVLQDVLAKRKGMTLDVSTSGALADSLDACIDPGLPSFNTLVRIMATRCMLSAEYFCSGSIARDAFGHYGLASPIYTHFTSPIRRYADVLVHRQLSAAVSGNPLHAGLQTKSFVEKTLEVVNKRHRGAQKAARASIEFYVALAIRRREELEVSKGGTGKVRADAFVIRTFRNGLAVFVSQFGLEGLVTFKRENKYDADTYEISIPSDPSEPDGAAVRIGVFDKVLVEISVEKDRNTQRGKVTMALIEPVDSRGL